jgi:hypothetical protein
MEFVEFLEETASKGEVVNLVFEEHLFNLVGILGKIAGPFGEANIPYEVVGGLAVLIHVEEADPTHSVLARHVDILINRSDLERAVAVAESEGFRFRHAAGVDMPLCGDEAVNAIRLSFSGDEVKSAQTTAHPLVASEHKTIQGHQVPVIPVADLVRMKLSANRDKDRVHLRSLDASGLITPEIESGLPQELQTRLRQVRKKE